MRWKCFVERDGLRRTETERTMKTADTSEQGLYSLITAAVSFHTSPCADGMDLIHLTAFLRATQRETGEQLDV